MALPRILHHDLASARTSSTVLWARGVAALALLGTAAAAQAACPALLDYTLPRLQDEKPVNLCQYAGKVVLVVNTASYCGFTPQYKSLEALDRRYRERGLVVLGFPTNDFGQQEPGADGDIAAFCENTFNVKFPMFSKSQVKPGASGPLNPLFVALAKRSEAPEWNFHKYLLGRDGELVRSIPSKVDPQNAAVVQDIERLLAKP